tara:strand:- start:1001 stop:1441 length:441 start_codon:yes stop_codon:yes gene_type:complete
MNIKQKTILILSIISLLLLGMFIVFLDREYFGSEPIQDEYVVYKAKIGGSSSKKHRGKKLYIKSSNENGEYKFTITGGRASWKWNLSEISDSIVFGKKYSEDYQKYYPNKLKDMKIVFENTSSILITYKIGGLFGFKYILDIECFY